MQSKRATVWAFVVSILVAGSMARADEPVARRAEFQTSDGVTIVGDFFEAKGDKPAPLAVLLHMYRHERSTWKPLVGPLHDAGFAVLAIDLRGHGESTKPEDKKLAERMKDRDPELFAAMHLDVAAAVAWARKQAKVDAEKLVIVGASVGCSVAIDYAGRDESVDAVVCMSPGTNYLGMDSTAQIKKTRSVPILLLAEEGERAAVDTLTEIAPNAKGEIVGPGKTHGTRMFGEIDGIEGKIVEFLGAAAKGE